MTGTLRTTTFTQELGQPGRATGEFSWRAAILPLLLVLLLSTAAQARPNPVTVSVSPEVEKAIKASDPKTAARMKKAIQVGNKFVRLRFNNEDAYSPEDEDGWNKTIAPLVTMKGEEWQEWLDKRWPIEMVTNLPNGWRQSVSLMACPTLTLLEIKSANNDISLTYLATLAAGYIQIYPDTPGKSGHRNWIEKKLSGHPYKLTIGIGPNNRITSELSSEKYLAFQYLYYRDSFLRSAEADESNGKKLQRLDILNDAKLQRQLIAEIDSATSICNTTSIKLNE